MKAQKKSRQKEKAIPERGLKKGSRPYGHPPDGNHYNSASLDNNDSHR